MCIGLLTRYLQLYLLEWVSTSQADSLSRKKLTIMRYNFVE